MQPAKKRLRIEALLVIAVLIVGVVVLFFTSVWSIKRAPIHTDPAAVTASYGTAPPSHLVAPVDEARKLARELLVTDNLPGLSVAVALDGAVVWSEALGFYDVTQKSPLTPLSRVRLGALSKPMTAFAAALLRDEGKLDLDAPVQRYVRAYPDKVWKVTTRQLLSDVAGVQRIRGDNNDAMPNAECSSVGEAVAMLKDEPLRFEPGTQHRYSIWGWVLVSAAVEGAAGEPFSKYVTRQVFERLGMSRTIALERDASDEFVRSLPPGSIFGIKLGAEEEARPDYSCLAGGGAFLSTPTDLVRFGSAAIKPGILKAETIDEFQTPAKLSTGEISTYALGWTISKVDVGGRNVRMASHRGSASGDSTSLLTFPELGLVVAVASNSTSAAGVNPFALKLADLFARAAK